VVDGRDQRGLEEPSGIGMGKLAARQHKTEAEAAKEAAYNAEMAKLYAQHVLKEQPTLQIQGLGGKKKASEPAEVLHKPTL
jgi:hypothetical protein